METMYYIYHIPGVKIGCSTNPTSRVKRQGYIDFEILEEHSDIDLISERELQLQKEYGYKVDTTLYKKSRNQLLSGITFETRSKGGKIGGKIGGAITGPINGKKSMTRFWKENREQQLEYCSRAGKVGSQSQIENKIGMFGYSKEEQSKIQKNASKFGGVAQSQIERTCPHCGKVGKGNGMFAYHFDRCKVKF